MKRFFLSLCFVTLLSAGLVSCADEAAEVAPMNTEIDSPQFATDGAGTEKDTAKRPTSN